MIAIISPFYAGVPRMADLGAMRFRSNHKYLKMYAKILGLEIVNFTAPGVNDILYHIRGMQFRLVICVTLHV